MSSFKRALSDIQKLEDRLFFQLLEGAKEKIALGKKYPSNTPCWIAALVTNRLSNLQASFETCSLTRTPTASQRDRLPITQGMVSAQQRKHTQMHGDDLHQIYSYIIHRDTTWNTLLGFVKAMVLFPDVQRKAQEEIDQIIGADCMPSWEDRERLPYIRAVVEETLRCTLAALIDRPNAHQDLQGHRVRSAAPCHIRLSVMMSTKA